MSWRRKRKRSTDRAKNTRAFRERVDELVRAGHEVRVIDTEQGRAILRKKTEPR